MKSILIVVYSQMGTSLKVARALQKKLGADIYEVKTKRTYNDDMWKAWDEAQEETASGKLPELSGQLPDLSGYDTIILGGPVWGLTLSNPLLAFIRQSDFKGKTISAFWTFYDHDEKYVQDVKKECAGAIVKAGLSLPRSAMRSESSLSGKLDGWIADLKEV